MQDSEESLRQALLIERLANVARDAGAKPEAALDVARRVVIDHAGEILMSGMIRLGSGASVHDAIESTRAEMPEYWRSATATATAPAPAPAPASPPTTTAGRRKRASDRLGRANGDMVPCLNPGPRRNPGEAA
ncbi:MAG: hypothetical protein ACOH2M_10235 [Cypionkella sp.]